MSEFLRNLAYVLTYAIPVALLGIAIAGLVWTVLERRKTRRLRFQRYP